MKKWNSRGVLMAAAVCVGACSGGESLREQQQPVYWRNGPGACEATSESDVPDGVPVYASETECNPSGCDCTVGTDNTWRGPLACQCRDSGDCPATLAEAKVIAATQCSVPPLTISQGCGLTELSCGGLFVSAAWVFDATSGALVGTFGFNDEGWGSCGANTYIAGREFACSTATTCVYRGPSPDQTWPDCPSP